MQWNRQRLSTTGTSGTSHGAAASCTCLRVFGESCSTSVGTVARFMLLEVGLPSRFLRVGSLLLTEPHRHDNMKPVLRWLFLRPVYSLLHLAVLLYDLLRRSLSQLHTFGLLGRVSRSKLVSVRCSELLAVLELWKVQPS